MIVRVDDRIYRGRAVDIDAPVAPETLARAVRDGRAVEGDRQVRVLARTPSAVHDHVGCISWGMSLRPKTALAATARMRGHSSPVDDALSRARSRLAALEAESVDARDRRRAVAAASQDTAALRERVATTRGRLQAGEADGETLTAAIQELSEAETAAAAARERLEGSRQRAREARDTLDERLRIEDRVANLERRARAALVDAVRDTYHSSLGAVPGCDPPADPFDGPPDAMALAVARLARPAAPVVLACDRFADAAAAARWLDAPVCRL